MAARRRDSGFTLLEVVVVITILGIVAAISTLAVRGVTTNGHEGACNADRITLGSAVDLYMFEQDTGTIPGADAEERMESLVDAGYLRSPSSHFEITPDGSLVELAGCGRSS